MNLWDEVVTPREILDKFAEKNWPISSGELARVLGLQAAAITKKGDQFSHDTWTFQRIKRQGNNYIWSVQRNPVKST